MSETKYSDLDFLQIKENLKTFLKSQSKFKDYNFDGSGMSVLLDLLAYNTAYNGFYLNMLASEMFLDSAALRESVVSRAKHLSYVPSSRKALYAVVDIEFDFSKSGLKTPDPGAGFLIKRTNALYCVSDGVRYTFSPKQDVYAQPIGNKKYVAKGVHLIEGKRLTYQWTYDSTKPIKQKFEIPNPDIDVTTLSVIVKDSATSTNKTPFYQFKDLGELTDKEPIFFLEEVPGQKYEIIFGDGILGKKLVDGNVIQIEYVVPTNDVATGATTFYPVIGWDVDVAAISNIKCVASAREYSEKETIASIKYNAPKLFGTQNRAVTKNDYEALLRKDISIIDPKIQYLRVWGGEEESPPQYGKVFCAIKPQNALALSVTDKERIIETYIRPKNMISIDVEIVEPDYMGLTISSVVNYLSTKTTNTKDTIKKLVVDKIKQFRSENLVGFDSDFRYSKFVKYVDDSDSSIESNVTDVMMKYQIQPVLSSYYTKTISLNNEFDRGDATNNIRSITSSSFYFINRLVMISDDGLGKLHLYPANTSKAGSIKEIGSVDYVKGTITLKNLVVDSIPNGRNYIEIYVKPKYNDIILYKNQILLLDDSDINVTVVDLLSVKLS